VLFLVNIKHNYRYNILKVLFEQSAAIVWKSNVSKKTRSRSLLMRSTWSDSQWTVLLGGHEAVEGGRTKEEA
jgi:hypothetical protein